MATKKPATAIDAEVVEMQEYVDAQSLNPALDQIRADLNITGDADVTCHVSKLDADGKGVEYKVWQGDPDEYSLDAIAKRFGSGQYRIMVYMKMPSGHKVRQINKVQAVMLAPEDEARVVAARAAATNPPEPKMQDNTGLLIQAMTQGFQGLGELIVKATQKPEVDPMAQMTALAGVIKTIMPTPTAAPVDPMAGFAGMLNMIKLFNDVSGANKPSLPADADSSTALMMAGLDMFKPVVQKALESKGGNASAPIQPQPSAPALDAPPTASGDEPEEVMLFKMYLKIANKAAASGANPAEYADGIYDKLPDEVLHSMALDAQWFDYIVKAVPDCEQYKAWYSGVRDALITISIDDGVFVRSADGALTLASEDAQNAGTSNEDSTDALGKGTGASAAS